MLASKMKIFSHLKVHCLSQQLSSLKTATR